MNESLSRKLRLRTVCAALAAAVTLPCATATAADYYVSPRGNDGNPGTSTDKAFGSIAKAG